MTLLMRIEQKVPEIVEGDGPLADRYGRVVTSLRISLNASALCNYRCVFCHMEGINGNFETLMTADEIARIVRVLACPISKRRAEPMDRYVVAAHPMEH